MTTTMKRKQTPKQVAFQFFITHAAYSYDPKIETARTGRARSARELAKAERDGRNAGLTFTWESDDPFISHGRDRSEWPESCESCVCYSEDGKALASLGCIDDATAEYRRVVEAELAQEALAELGGR